MAGARPWVVLLVILATGCVGRGETVTPAQPQAPANPTHQLCRNVVYAEALPQPMANFVVYNWGSLHPWVRAAADDYTSDETAENAAELERQCTSFLSLLDG